MPQKHAYKTWVSQACLSTNTKVSHAALPSLELTFRYSIIITPIKWVSLIQPRFKESHLFSFSCTSIQHIYPTNKILFNHKVTLAFLIPPSLSPSHTCSLLTHKFLLCSNLFWNIIIAVISAQNEFFSHVHKLLWQSHLEGHLLLKCYLPAYFPCGCSHPRCPYIFSWWKQKKKLFFFFDCSYRCSEACRASWGDQVSQGSKTSVPQK